MLNVTFCSVMLFLIRKQQALISQGKCLLCLQEILLIGIFYREETGMHAKKRIIGVILAVVLSAALLAGCGTKKESSSSETAASEADSGGSSNTITLSDGTTYPSGTITIICPYTTGGGTDIGIRTFAKYAKQYTDADIVVENITGGDGLIGISAGFNRGSDGDTLWHIDTGPQYVTTIKAACPFYVLKDMALIGQLVCDDRVWVARKDDTRFSNGEEFFAYAKAHPGEISCGVSGSGTISGVSTVYLSNLTGADLNVTGFNGVSEATVAFLQGDCDIMTAGVSEVASMLENDQCKVLFTLTDERIYDEAPTVKELGYDALSASSDRGLAMHGKTDPAIVQYWSDIMDKVCADPAFLEEMEAQSFTVLHRNSAEFTEHFEKLYDFWYDLKAEMGE